MCNRREFDEPVAVQTLERFLADTASRYELKLGFEKFPVKRQKIAAIGAGPSGLAFSYFMARLGYQTDVFEALSAPGGVLRWGIPLYRLPSARLDEEIAQIQELGVRIHCNKPVDQKFLQDAKGAYDAIFLGCGHAHSLPLKIPGEDLDGVESGLRFLAKIRRGEEPPLHGTVAVVGGGNTAIDTARSAARLGGKVLLIYRRRRQDMPAFHDEVAMAQEEGVEICELKSPVKIASQDGDLVVTLQQMRVLEEDDFGQVYVQPDSKRREEIRVQHLFTAIGASAAEAWQDPPKKRRGLLRLSNCALLPQSRGPVLVYGGDLVASIKSVVHAVASGKQSALALDTYFTDGSEAVQPKLQTCLVGDGPAISMEVYMGGSRTQRSRSVVGYEDLNTDYFHSYPRMVQPSLLREERIQSFAEIHLKIGASLAIREAERCFNCGICNHCDNCHLFCPEIAVMRESNPQNRQINYEYCKGCGLCVVECPRSAMKLEEECL